MTDKAILEYGKERGIRNQTLKRWLNLPESDQSALLDLAHGLRIGENHLRDFLDWAEEISLRDGLSLCKIIKGESIEPIWSDPRLGRGDKLRRIKEAMRRQRFPRLMQMEREIQKRIRAMGIGSQIQFSVPSGLEGGTLTVHLSSTSEADLRKLVGELGELLERSEIKEIFEYLSGRAVK